VHDVPGAAGEAEGDRRSARAVVVLVMAPDVVEVGQADHVEVHRVVDPLLDHVALQERRHEDRRGRQRRQEAEAAQQQRERQRVEEAVDVETVPRPAVVVAVHRVEEAVQRVPQPTRPVGEAAVQHVAVDEVLDPGPEHDAQQHERERSARCALDRARDHGQRVGRVQHGHGIEPPARGARFPGEVDPLGVRRKRYSVYGLQDAATRRFHGPLFSRPPGTDFFHRNQGLPEIKPLGCKKRQSAGAAGSCAAATTRLRPACFAA